MKKIMSVWLCIAVMIGFCNAQIVSADAAEYERSQFAQDPEYDNSKNKNEDIGNSISLFSYSTGYPNTHTNTGNQAVDIAEIAKTQVGYAETATNHTKYNYWYYGSDTGAAWCAIFISWCANEAGVSTSVIAKNAVASGYSTSNMGSNPYKCTAYSFSSRTPQIGDIIFVDNTGNGVSNHVGLVVDVDSTYIYTVEGNYSDKVSSVKYSRSTGYRNGSSSTKIVFYAAPNYEMSYQVLTAIDSPSEGENLGGDSFRIIGWVQSDIVQRITFSINGGSEYEMGIYWRSDVNGTGFLADLNSYEWLKYDANVIEIKAYLSDGTVLDVGTRNVVRYAALGWDNPKGDISTDTYLVNGWIYNEYSGWDIEYVYVLINNETKVKLDMYKREDVSFAEAFQIVLPTATTLNYGNNTISLIVHYTNGQETVAADRAISSSVINIEFNANGGTTSTASKSITYDSTYGTLPTPTRTGYAFKGWYTAASGGTQITSDTKVTTTSNQTLYAQWEQITYTISYNLNGADGAIDSCTYNWGESGKITETIPQRDGYNFIGWAASENAAAAEYLPGDSYTENKDITLYAVWKLIPYTKTTLTNRGSYYLCDIELHNIEEPCEIIVAKYKNKKLISVEKIAYSNNNNIGCAVFEAVDSVKIMTWETLDGMKPVTEPEVIEVQ